MTKIIITDENDNAIGSKERVEAKRSEIYRITALWLENQKGEILITERAQGKSYSSKWGMAAGGTVEVDETYDSNIEKEIEEELGIRSVPYEKGPKLKIFGTQRRFCQVYMAKMELNIDDLEPDEEEIAQLRWVKEEELIKDVKLNSGKYTPAMCELIKAMETSHENSDC